MQGRLWRLQSIPSACRSSGNQLSLSGIVTHTTATLLLVENNVATIRQTIHNMPLKIARGHLIYALDQFLTPN